MAVTIEALIRRSIFMSDVDTYWWPTKLHGSPPPDTG